jgi:hypothetical protein
MQKNVKHTAAYIATGTKVINSVSNDAELVSCPTRSADVEVPLSREEPTRGSLLSFCGAAVSNQIVETEGGGTYNASFYKGAFYNTDIVNEIEPRGSHLEDRQVLTNIL